MRYLFILLFSLQASAIKNSRPKSIAGDYLIEFNSGFVYEEKEDVFEIGFDFEKFIDGADHHFSIGLAAEIEFLETEEDFYLGPLFSAYYFHMKFFVTTGLLTNFDDVNEWKSRIGIGYEYFPVEHYIIIPTVALDFIDGETHFAWAIGFAHEF